MIEFRLHPNTPEPHKVMPAAEEQLRHLVVALMEDYKLNLGFDISSEGDVIRATPMSVLTRDAEADEKAFLAASRNALQGKPFSAVVRGAAVGVTH